MDFARLFPATQQELKEEICILGKEFSLKDVQFEKLVPTAIPDATFIDGGSAVLFSSPSRCIGIIKVAMVQTTGLQRKNITAYSYLVSITANNGFLVRSEPLGVRNPDIAKCLDGEFLVNPETTPEQFLDTLRTLAEYAIAPEGIIVRDGSLRTTDHILQQHCKPTEKTVALAKTSQVLTNLSRPLGLALMQRAPQGSWIAKLTDDACCVRLHPASGHVFFAEGNITETLSLLAAWSADMTFPGYPYPLVLVDQLARVTNNERDAWRIVLVNDKEAQKIIASEAKLSNAHAMLEHILYGKEL